MIDLNEMAIFAEVVEAGSFTKAGQKLGVPKSTISRKISLLEERLGVLLLHRTTRQLGLTDAGSSYYQYCSRIANEAKEADLIATRKQVTPTGIIKISAPPGFLFLSDYVSEFLTEWEKVTIEINFESRRVNLIEEGYDLCFRVGDLEDSNLIARTLGVARILFCASPEYIQRQGAPKTISDLQNHRLIQGIPWNITNSPELLPIDYRKRVKTNSNEMAIQMTKMGFGVSMLSETDCARDVREGALIQVLNDFPMPEKKIYMLYPSNRYLSVKNKMFIEYITNRWKSRPPW